MPVTFFLWFVSNAYVAVILECGHELGHGMVQVPFSPSTTRPAPGCRPSATKPIELLLELLLHKKPHALCQNVDSTVPFGSFVLGCETSMHCIVGMSVH